VSLLDVGFAADRQNLAVLDRQRFCVGLGIVDGDDGNRIFFNKTAI
jgi:hypothetical protein